MSLQDAFREVKEGQYKYYSVEKAINSYRKEKRLNIIEENLAYLISCQESDNIGFRYLSHKLLVDAIKDWTGEAIINESYDRFKKCLEFLERWRRSGKSPTFVTAEALRRLIEKINFLMEEYEIRKKTEAMQRVIEE